jgi:prolyl oligopeptidase
VRIWGHFRIFLLVCFPGILIAAPPPTTKRPVQDTYHGTVVIDDYRWLEEPNSEEVKAWSASQNSAARAYLAQLPAVTQIANRLEELLTTKVVAHSDLTKAGDKIFARKVQPPKEQDFLVVMPSVLSSDKARVIVDPNQLDSSGTTTIDWYVPSPDGSLVAVSLSRAGSEAGDVHVFDTESAKQVYEVIPRVQNGTAAGDLAWSADGKGFYYTRYPRGNERPAADMDFFQQVFYHALGTPTQEDRYEIGKDFPRIAEIKLQMHNPRGRLLCSMQNGDGGEFAHFVRLSSGQWRQITSFKDKIVQAIFASTGELFLVSRQGAPKGKILMVSADELDLEHAKDIIPQGNDTIVTSFYSKPTMVPTADRLYVTYQLGGPSEIRAFDFTGQPVQAPKQLPISAVRELTPLDGNDLLFSDVSYVHPGGQYLFRAGTGETTLTSLTAAPSVKFDDIEVVREFALSTDGTKVPVSILMPKKMQRDGKNACIVTGYGGYGISMEPAFMPQLRLLFDHGIVYAVANLRGGGEFGEAWHQAGNLTKKQNVFDDFAAVLKHLIERKYTSPERLGIEGGSNGGLLMGATLTQHPELMKAVVSFVGIYDMLRVELSSNGSFNVPEFGSVKDPEQFKALWAYSPYHNVRDGIKYPAVLFLTGANDPRVDPMQSRKMTARLQEASSSGAPILLRTNDTAGHGMGTALSERIKELADVYAFFFQQLGVR